MHPVLESTPGAWDYVYNTLAIILFLFVLAFFATRRLSKDRPSFLQAGAEQVYKSFEYLCVSVIGEHGRKFIPVIGTVFIFILLGNLWGQLGWISEISYPLAHFKVVPPTSSLNTTLPLAVLMFLIVQTAGIRANGFTGYLKHFMGPVAFLAPLFFLIEIIGELAKPLSLSLRLYGNIYGEKSIVTELAKMGLDMPIPIPVQLPMLAFGVFVSVVQALVFTMLSCVYIALITAHDEDHADHEGHGAAEHHAHAEQALAHGGSHDDRKPVGVGTH